MKSHNKEKICSKIHITRHNIHDERTVSVAHEKKEENNNETIAKTITKHTKMCTR